MVNKEKIFNDLEKFRKQLGLTYADVETIFYENGFDYHGDRWLINYKYSNIVYWPGGWNNEAVKLIGEYMKKFNLVRQPVNVIAYLTSGSIPEMPIAKAKTEKQIANYKKPHWLPVEFVSKDRLKTL